MKKILTTLMLAHVLFFSCKIKSSSLEEQLKINFLSHLTKIDSTVVLDSFRLVRIDSIDQRLERTVDDTIYTREFIRVKAQLTNAIKEKKEDSIGFYQGEVDYMTPQVDSLNKVISKADTTEKLGMVATCKIQLSRLKGNQEGIFYYFLDNNFKIWNSEMVDSGISSLARKLN